MEVVDVKSHIKTGKFDPFYVFHGEEHGVMKIYIHKIAEKMGATVEYPESYVDVRFQSRVAPLIPTPHVYVIMDDKEFLTDEKLWEFKRIPDTVVIFYYTSTDKRLKFWKNMEERAVEFTKLDYNALVKYIQKKQPLNADSCRELINCCEGDYSTVMMELDKIVYYINAVAGPNDNVDVNEVFEYLLAQGVIYQAPKDAIFDFVSAFLDRDTIKAQELLRQSYEVGEANMVILSVLYNSVKTLLQVQSGDFKSLGLNGYSVKNVMPYKNKYTNGELVHCMKLIHEFEKGIKTGAMPDDISIQYIMVNVM